MVKTAVFEVGGSWWFQWQNVAENVLFTVSGPEVPAGTVIAQNREGPFQSRADAELARKAFEDARAEEYPWERISSE